MRFRRLYAVTRLVSIMVDGKIGGKRARLVSEEHTDMGKKKNQDGT